jgi:hypothetical protein
MLLSIWVQPHRRPTCSRVTNNSPLSKTYHQTPHLDGHLLSEQGTQKARLPPPSIPSGMIENRVGVKSRSHRPDVAPRSVAATDGPPRLPARPPYSVLRWVAALFLAQPQASRPGSAAARVTALHTESFASSRTTSMIPRRVSYLTSVAIESFGETPDPSSLRPWRAKSLREKSLREKSLREPRARYKKMARRRRSTCSRASRPPP